MPSADKEALAAAKAQAMTPDGKIEWERFDWEAYQQDLERRRQERYEQLCHEAQASWQAMDGW